MASKLKFNISSILARIIFFISFKDFSSRLYFSKKSLVKIKKSFSLSENKISIFKLFLISSDSSIEYFKILEISFVIWFPPIGIV